MCSSDLSVPCLAWSRASSPPLFLLSRFRRPSLPLAVPPSRSVQEVKARPTKIIRQWRVPHKQNMPRLLTGSRRDGRLKLAVASHMLELSWRHGACASKAVRDRSQTFAVSGKIAATTLYIYILYNIYIYTLYLAALSKQIYLWPWLAAEACYS